MAVILNNGWCFAKKAMYVGRQCAGQQWTDIMDWAWGEVIIDENGIGVFPVGHRSMGVWVNGKAEGRTKLNRLIFDEHIYKHALVVEPGRTLNPPGDFGAGGGQHI